MGRSIARQTHKGIDESETFVHQQPWKMIGVGIGVTAGLMLGYILARRG